MMAFPSPSTSESDLIPSLADGVAMSLLLQTVRDLSSCKTFEEIVEVVRHSARQLVSSDGATFVLRDKDKCYYVDEDAVSPLWRGQRFPLEACISGWAMTHSKQVIIPDIYSDSRVPHEAYRPTFVQSLVMTPVRSGSAMAAIGTYWADQHFATESEQALLQALADSTAVALENARTLQVLETRIQERTAELVAMNADLAAFAHLAAHDLKEPLSTVMGYAELVSLDPGLSDSSRQWLGVTQNAAARMGDLIEGVLSYSTAATSELNSGVVDTQGLVASVLADVSSLVERREVSVEVGTLPDVFGSQMLLERVLQNLIVNAIHYGAAQNPVVGIFGEVCGGYSVLKICDNGQGVPQAERENIFGMFQRGSTAVVPGSGIGLAFARRVVERHRGSLEVTDCDLGGACFTVRLPVGP